MPDKYDAVEIVFLSGVQDGTQFLFRPSTLPDGRITIGRDNENAISIQTDATISRYHAILYWQGGSWWLQDLDSKNGTFVEHHSTLQRDVKVRGIVQLEVGQLFRVGKTWLRFQPENGYANAS